MMKKFSIILLSFICSVALSAKVIPAQIFGDNMVLQQNSDVAFWGKAEPGAKLTIRPSWIKKPIVVNVDSQGKWFVRMHTPEAGGPYEIVVSDGDELKISNVLIGEVWICAGQSNMEMRMKGSTGQPVNGAADMILKARQEVPIRSCNVRRNTSLAPEYSCRAKWDKNTPEGVAEASAVAYFFAHYLYEVLDVPVGIINVSWGGTPIEAWMSREVIEEKFKGEFNMSCYEKGVLPEKNPQFAPGTLYNGMLHPIIPYTAKGLIWYQGCANRNRWKQYGRLQPAFVEMLRKEWDNEKMPFYFTQIAPYSYKNPQDREAAFLMWVQAQTLKDIPYSGMAATHDVGEFSCIHPASKRQVGERLAYQALENDYGVSGIDSKTPLPVSYDFSEGAAVVKFSSGRLGISPINIELEGSFELAGEDKIFYPAKAKIEKDRKSVRIYSPEVPAPVAVRYGMRNWSEALLFNCYGIPVSPFRSDDWNE